MEELQREPLPLPSTYFAYLLRLPFDSWRKGVYSEITQISFFFCFCLICLVLLGFVVVIWMESRASSMLDKCMSYMHYTYSLKSPKSQ